MISKTTPATPAQVRRGQTTNNMQKKPNIKIGQLAYSKRYNTIFEVEEVECWMVFPVGPYLPYNIEDITICKPILFSTDMVKANNNRTKTQTRRLNKLHEVNKDPDRWHFNCITRNNELYFSSNGDTVLEKTPWQKGDILYVRERWMPNIEAKLKYLFMDDFNDPIKWAKDCGFKWKPSIHMPAVAARTFLQVEDVRVERLDAITDDGAKAEGIKINPLVGNNFPYWNYHTGDFRYQSPIASFRSLWDKINEPRGYGWDKNPWVIVVEYSKLNIQL